MKMKEKNREETNKGGGGGKGKQRETNLLSRRQKTTVEQIVRKVIKVRRLKNCVRQPHLRSPSLHCIRFRPQKKKKKYIRSPFEFILPSFFTIPSLLYLSHPTLSQFPFILILFF